MELIKKKDYPFYHFIIKDYKKTGIFIQYNNSGIGLSVYKTFKKKNKAVYLKDVFEISFYPKINMFYITCKKYENYRKIVQ